jgi:plastocyanin
MKRLLVVAVAVAMLGTAGAFAATRVVRITSTGFSPQARTITAGDRIAWRNTDTVRHQVVSDAGTFASPVLRPGGTYTYTFTRTGTYRYHDALFPGRTGRVVVRARPLPAAAVSITASLTLVKYGEKTTLSGGTSRGRANEIVSIFALEHGQASFVHVASVLTSAGGGWTYLVKPRFNTIYRATYRDSTSTDLTVAVRPKITLAGSRTHFYARVTAARSYAGHFIVLQRLRTNGTWAGIRRLKLNKRSGRLMRVPRRSGTYRVFLTAKQAGPGYVASWSGTQPVRR